MTTLLLILLAVSLVYYVFSTYLTAAFFGDCRKPYEVAESRLPPVSIIKPVAGAGLHYLDYFSTFCTQEYPEYEVVFCLAGMDDPSISIIDELKRNFPEREIRWITAGCSRGPNYKVDNLVGAVNAARHEIVVMSDSDMRVGSTYLKEVVGALLRDGAGMVTCLYRGVHITNIPSALQALSIQADFLPNVVLDERMEGISYGFGATICTTKSILQSIGGLEPLRDYLADDYQIGNRIHRTGRTVRLSNYLVDHVSSLNTFRDLFHLSLRWAITQRVSRPLGYGASIVTHGMLFATLALILQGFSPPAIALFLFTALVRVGCFYYLNTAVIRNGEIGRWVWLIPIRDLFGSLVWFLSLFTDVVRWRQRRFRVLRDGKMIEC